MNELFMFGYLNCYYSNIYMFLSMWLYNPQSVLILFYFCLVKVIKVVSTKQPSPNNGFPLLKALYGGTQPKA